MRRFLNLILPLVMAVVGIAAPAAPARAASYGVNDHALFFSTEARDRADDLIQNIRDADHRDVLVVTYDDIAPELQGQFYAKGEDRFFADWAESVARDQGVNGVIILMTRNPGHLEIDVGEKTRLHSFTLDDRDQLKSRMLALLGSHRYDDALLKGLQFIKARMRPVAANDAAAQNPSAGPGYGNPTGGTSGAFPGFSIGGLVCVSIAILLIVMLVMGIVNRNRGYGAPPPGGYPPGYSGGYPQGGGYYGGGGGGGFGGGFLGSILGGALGSWGYDRFMRPDNSSNYIPPPPGGSATGGDFGNSNQNDTSFSGTGGDFDSGGSGSSGGDFGSSSDSSGGGGDFGGGGGDSGSSGGDF